MGESPGAKVGIVHFYIQASLPYHTLRAVTCANPTLRLSDGTREDLQSILASCGVTTAI